MPLIEFPPAGVTDVSRSPYLQRLIWIRGVSAVKPITIAVLTTAAGFQSQLISHTINITENRQTSCPIRISDYCFVDSNSVLSGDAVLFHYCVLGAKSLLNKAYTQRHRPCGGVPARELSLLSPDCGYSTAARVSSPN